MIRRFALISFGLILALAVGACLGLTILRPPVPPSLTAAEQIVSAPVTEREYADSRSVTLSITPGNPTTVTAPKTGRITAISATPGGEISSGTTVLHIDGVPIHALATRIPLWRNLEKDMRGDDITALQSELGRLGYSVWESGTFDWDTRAALADLLDAHDQSGRVPDSIEYDRILWIPAQKVVVENIPVHIGQTTEASTEILTLAGTGAHIQLTPPEGAMSGQRIITLGNITTPVDTDGKVTDSNAINQILTSPQFQEAKNQGAADKSAEGGGNSSNGAISLKADWALRTPTKVSVIPPAALFGINGNKGCVAESGQPIPVTIVTSEVGQTFVTSTHPLSMVDLETEGIKCPLS